MSDRSNLIEHTVDQLRARIRSGEWEVGSRIPTEPALTELLGVGRNTVREAVQSLVHAGLLTRRQGSGTYVRSTSEVSVAIGRQFEDAHYVHILEVRRSLEVEAARLAARNRTTEDVTHLREVNAERQEAFIAGNIERMVSADVALHNTIAQISKNPVLASLYESLTDAVSQSIRRNVEKIVRSHVNDNHDDLIEAIVLGDQYLAMEEMGSYLEHYIENQATVDEPNSLAQR
ncbi:FadR/GntR family transcriptional regulator [Timonella sp. A28]|uniref:FadR/GntR family transcriptional regulator n=1 Tax=Timonella sp. A28 TaxID=3442640 RepID=UPI003EBEBD9F